MVIWSIADDHAALTFVVHSRSGHYEGISSSASGHLEKINLRPGDGIAQQSGACAPAGESQLERRCLLTLAGQAQICGRR